MSDGGRSRSRGRRWLERHSVKRPRGEALALRFPLVMNRLTPLGGRAWARLPAGSAVRRRLMKHGVYRAYAAFNRRDLEILEGLHHRDCVFDMSPVEGWTESPIYERHEGLRRYLDDWHAQWRAVRYEPAEIREHRRGVILIESHVRAVGRSSGVSVETSFFQVAEPRDGLIWRVVNYTDREQALQAALNPGARRAASIPPS